MEALLISPLKDEADILEIILQHAGFVIHFLTDIRQAAGYLDAHPTDFIILTISRRTPELINQLRRFRGITIAPMVVITDPLPEDLTIELLDTGIDMVINRPYSSLLLLYQVRALLRRSNTLPFLGLPKLTLADVRLDPSTRSVTIGLESPIHLTQLEFRLLYTLMSHVDQVIPTENLVEHVWGYPAEGNRELVRGLVQRLRAKIEVDPHEPRYILTEPGIGYWFRQNFE